MDVSKNNGTPKSSILIGFGTIIKFIHFGMFPPIFWKHPYTLEVQRVSSKTILLMVFDIQGDIQYTNMFNTEK